MDGIISFVLLPLASFAALSAIFASIQFKEIKDNIVQWRCHPLVILTASWFGLDPVSNCYDCLNEVGKSVIASQFDPLKFLFGTIGGVMKDLSEGMDDVRGLVTRMRTIVQGFTSTVFGKLQNGMGQLVILLARVRDVFARMIGAGILQAYMTSAMLSTLDSFFGLALSFVKTMIIAIFAIAILLSFILPELLVFAIGLGASLGILYCFDPETLVTLEDGTPAAMGALKPGAVLRGDSGDKHRVTGVLSLTSLGVSMYSLGGVIVSGHHKVYDPSGPSWIYVQDHPEAKRVRYDYDRPLACLITDTNRIPINGRLFCDYEEVSDPESLLHIDEIVTGRPGHPEPYPPGFSPSTRVRLRDGTLRAISELVPGDLLPDDNQVDAVVCQDATDVRWYWYDGVMLSGTTKTQRRTRATVRGIPAPREVWHLVTRTGSIPLQDSRDFFQDYLDTHDLDKLDAIERFVMKKLNSDLT